MGSAAEHAVVAIYETHARAEGGIQASHDAGLDVKRLSLLGKDCHTAEPWYTADEHLQVWGGRAAAGRLLVGSAFFFIPAVGPLMVLGPLVGWIAGALEGASIGAAVGVLGAALVGIGIPRDSVIKYEFEVKSGKFLVLARGDAALAQRAHAILARTGPTQLVAHPA